MRTYNGNGKGRHNLPQNKERNDQTAHAHTLTERGDIRAQAHEGRVLASAWSVLVGVNAVTGRSDP